MPLDPQVTKYLRGVAALGLPPVEQLTPEQARANTESAAAALFGPKEEVARIEEVQADGVRVRLYTPDGSDGAPILVYFHGGGWVHGSLDTVDGTCRALANRARCRVASVDYRLSPENRFPAAVDDAWTVTRWAFQQTPAVAVGGDSAGGNLAAVVAIRCRDQGWQLTFQLLIYPVLDHDFSTASYRTNGSGYGLTEAAMRWYWAQYLGDADGGQAEASPLRAGSLAGLAPALVVACEFDPLRDEDVAYAERLRAEGTRVRLSEYRGMIHGFVRMAAVIDRTNELLDECAEGVREAFAGAPTTR